MPIPIGATLAFFASVLHYQPAYKRRIVESAPVPVAPEHRLYEAFVGVPALVVAGVRSSSLHALTTQFWLGWTSQHVGIWPPLMSGLLLGAGLQCVHDLQDLLTS